MQRAAALLSRLEDIRDQFDRKSAREKKELLAALARARLTSAEYVYHLHMFH